MRPCCSCWDCGLVAFLLLDAVVKTLSSTVRLTFMLLFWLSPWFLYDSLLYNPSYLPLFAALHFWSAFQLREKGPFWRSFGCSGAVCGCHRHGHAVSLLLAAAGGDLPGYLLVMGRLRFNWLGILASVVALVGLSLWPYFHEMMNNQSISREANPDAQARYIGWGLVHGIPSSRRWIYRLRYSSPIFTTKLINGVEFLLAAWPWLQWSLVALWKGCSTGWGRDHVRLVLLANRYGWKQVRASIWRRRREQAETPRTRSPYGAAAVLAVIVCAVGAHRLQLLAPDLGLPFALFRCCCRWSTGLWGGGEGAALPLAGGLLLHCCQSGGRH